MNVTRLVPTLALPTLLALAACSDDLESRNAALGMEEDGSEQELTIERQAPTGSTFEEEETAELPDDEEAQPVEGEAEEDAETVVEAGPDDLIDRAEGFAPEPMDNAAGFNPSPHVHNSAE